MDLIAIAAVTLIGLLLFWAMTSNEPSSDRGVLRLGIVFHAVFPHVLWGIMTDRNEGDLFMFYRVGQDLLEGFWYDSDRYGTEIAHLLFASDSTSFMIGSAAVLLGCVSFPTAANVVVSYFALLGQLLLYRGLRDHVPERSRWSLLASCMLVPSVSFWTSGLVKEAFALGGLGIAVYGFSHLLRGARRAGVTWLLVGMWVISRAKPYVLFPLLIAFAVWWFWARQSAAQRAAILSRPWRIVGLLAMAATSIVLLSYFFPRFSPTEFATEATRIRGYSAAAGGGSSFALSEAPVETSLAGQLALAPLGMFNSLFRPLVFEIRNLLMVPAALESTAFLVIFAKMMISAGPRLVIQRTFASPVLLASAVFVVLFSIAVGVTTVNFGTLSRYRIPMLPFACLWMLLVTGGLRAGRPEAPPGKPARVVRRRPLPAPQ